MATPAEPVTDALFQALSSYRHRGSPLNSQPERHCCPRSPDHRNEGRDEGRVFRSQLADRHAGEGGLAGDLAAHHSAGRSYLWPALQGPY